MEQESKNPCVYWNAAACEYSYKNEEMKEALKLVTDAILNGVKEDLDGRRLGSESYFVK